MLSRIHQDSPHQDTHFSVKGNPDIQLKFKPDKFRYLQMVLIKKLHENTQHVKNYFAWQLNPDTILPWVRSKPHPSPYFEIWLAIIIIVLVKDTTSNLPFPWSHTIPFLSFFSILNVIYWIPGLQDLVWCSISILGIKSTVLQQFEVKDMNPNNCRS